MIITPPPPRHYSITRASSTLMMPDVAHAAAAMPCLCYMLSPCHADVIDCYCYADTLCQRHAFFFSATPDMSPPLILMLHVCRALFFAFHYADDIFAAADADAAAAFATFTPLLYGARRRSIMPLRCHFTPCFFRRRYATPLPAAAAAAEFHCLDYILACRAKDAADIQPHYAARAPCSPRACYFDA